jgi:Na+/phosphate symporter
MASDLRLWPLFRIVFSLLAGKFAAVMFAIIATMICFPLLTPGVSISSKQIIIASYLFVVLFCLFVVLCVALMFRARKILTERNEPATAENVYFVIFPDER